MSNRDDGGAAFPVLTDDERVPYQTGMSLRDYFAAQAWPVAWQLEVDRPTGKYSDLMEPTYSGAAMRAYFIADAMLKERAK